MDRIIGTPFQPGKSGNPSGRPAGTVGFRRQCRNIIEQEGLDSLLDMARSTETPANVRKDIWIYLCDQGHGKPKQAVVTEHEVNDEDIARLLEELAGRG